MSGGTAFSNPLDVFETYPEGYTGTARASEIVSFGFPFPEGQVSTVNALKVKGSSRYQFTPLAYWPDNSVKWALVDFQFSSLAQDQIDATAFAVEDGGSGSAGGSGICTQAGDVITVNTGTDGITAKVKRNGFNVLDEVKLNDASQTLLVSAGNEGGVVFVNKDNDVFNSNGGIAERFEIRQNGPARCQVVVEGKLEPFSVSGLGYRVIMDFFASQPYVDVSTSVKNSYSTSNTHKLTNGIQVVIDTTLEGVGVSGDVSNTSGSVQSFSIPADTQAVLTSFYTTVQNVAEGGSKLPSNPAGYAVELIPSGGGSSTFVVPRTSSGSVPEFQWLTIAQNAKKVRVTGRYAPYYYPNGATFDNLNGFLSYDIYAPTFPTKPVYVIPYRMYATRHFRANFNASPDSAGDTRRYTNKVIFIPVDRTHYGKAHAFFGDPFDSVNTSTIQSFVDASNIPVNNVCSNPSSYGAPMKVERGPSPNWSGGGAGNNVHSNITYFTFTGGTRHDFPTKEQLAQYYVDFETYLDDQSFTTYPATSAMKSLFGMGATNDAEVNSFFPGWYLEILDQAHNWAFQNHLDYYHMLGREEHVHGMETTYIRTWLSGFNYKNYVRPLGQQLQALSQVLHYLEETNHPQYANHLGFVEGWLTSDVLYTIITPDYGSYYWTKSQCDSTPGDGSNDDVCFGYHFDNVPGWMAPPGQKFNQSNSSLAPEIQSFDFDVYNAYATPDGSDPPWACRDGERSWMVGQRLTFGLLQMYYFMLENNPSSSNLEALRLRVLDMARWLAGDAVGVGAYKHDFSNLLDAWGWYVYCVMNKSKNSMPDSTGSGGTGNGYLFSYLYTFAAQQATTQEEKAWWHHMAVNQLLAIHSNGNGFTCNREYDPRVQHTINAFLQSGTPYNPQNYPPGTPYPDSSASFSLNSVSPPSIPIGVNATLTLSGSLFTSTDTVQIDSMVFTPTFINASTLSVFVSAAQTNALGVGGHAVKVVQNGTPSNSKTLSITQPTPVITSISPSKDAIGNAATLTLTGTGFTLDAKVMVDSAVNATVLTLTPASVSSTQVVVNLTAAQSTSLGTGIHLVWETQAGGTSNTKTWEAYAPKLYTLSPLAVNLGTSQLFTLTGDLFLNNAKVSVALWACSRPRMWINSISHLLFHQPKLPRLDLETTLCLYKILAGATVKRSR